MKDKKTIIYQLLSIALLVALVCTVASKNRLGKLVEAKEALLKDIVEKTPDDATTSATPKAAKDATTSATPKAADEKQGGWRTIKPSEIKDNSVELVADINGILAMGGKDEHNAMTIGWGAFGVLWRKPIYTVYVSTSRFSHSLMEKNGYFTVSFFNKSHKEDVLYLGHHSGRDGDKISKTKFHLNYTENGNPIFDEAFLVLECRKIYSSPFAYDKIDSQCRQMYDGGRMGIHTEFIGEIVNVFVNDANR